MEANRLVIEVLPPWVPWAGPAAYVLLAFLASTLISRCVAALMLRPLSKCAVDAWTERARFAFAARYAVCFTALLLTAAAGGLAPMFHGPASPLTEPLLAAFAGISALVPAVASARAMERHLSMKEGSIWHWLRGCTAFWLVLAPNLVVISAAAAVMPRGFTVKTAGALTITAFLVWLCVRGGGIWLAYRLGLVRPASTRILDIVARTGARLGFHPRISWEMAWDRANAFAIHGSQAVMFTDGALRHLSDAELEAVCAHEIGHLRENPGAQRARSLSGFLFFPLAGLSPIMARWGALGLLICLVAILLAAHAYARWSQQREFDADSAGCGGEEDEGALARALERIHAANLHPAVLGGKGSSHPDLYDRMLAAGVQPPYPRPRRPPRRQMVLLIAAAPVLMMSLLVALKLAPTLWATRQRKNELPIYWAISMGGDTGPLSSLARIRSQRGDLKTAIRLLEACSHLSPEDALYPAILSRYLSRDDQCEKAETMLDAAEQRRERYGSTDNEDEWIERARNSLRICRRRQAIRSGDRTR